MRGPYGSDVLLLHSGNITRFANMGGGTFVQEQDGTGVLTLAGDWTTGFTITAPDHAVDTFNTLGVRVSHTERNGNTTQYQYVDADLDGYTDELWRGWPRSVGDRGAPEAEEEWDEVNHGTRVLFVSGVYCPRGDFDRGIVGRRSVWGVAMAPGVGAGLLCVCSQRTAPGGGWRINSAAVLPRRAPGLCLHER